MKDARHGQLVRVERFDDEHANRRLRGCIGRVCTRIVNDHGASPKDPLLGEVTAADQRAKLARASAEVIAWDMPTHGRASWIERTGRSLDDAIAKLRDVHEEISRELERMRNEGRDAMTTHGRERVGCTRAAARSASVRRSSAIAERWTTGATGGSVEARARSGATWRRRTARGSPRGRPVLGSTPRAARANKAERNDAATTAPRCATPAIPAAARVRDVRADRAPRASVCSTGGRAQAACGAGAAVIPDHAWWALPRHPGPHRVLLLLWAYSAWHDKSEEPAFAWPSIERLAERLKLQPRAIRAAIDKLEELGYVRAATEVRRDTRGVREPRQGWRLFETPEHCDDYDRACAMCSQLDLFAGEPIEIDLPAAAVAPVDNSQAPPVDNYVPASDERRTYVEPAAQVRRQLDVPTSLVLKEDERKGAKVDRPLSEGAAHDDDGAAQIWTLYEESRVRLFGGVRRDSLPPPESLRALIAMHGATRVEAYAIVALRYAAAARDRGRSCAAARIAECSDGREWHPTRFDAVARWEEPEAAGFDAGPAAPARATPPRDPIVDGQRVTLWEAEAWRTGGEDAVRALRAQPTAEVASMAAELAGKPWMRAITGGP